MTKQPNERAAALRLALDLVREQDELRARVAAGLPEYHRDKYRCAAHYLANLADTLSDQLLDAGGFLGDEPEPEERAFILDRNGAVMAFYELDELDPDQYAERFADASGFDIDEGAGIIPDGCEDFSVKIAETPDAVRCWTSKNYMMKAEA